jgi:hypothetical protein
MRSGSFRAMESPYQITGMENESKGKKRVSKKLLLLGVLTAVVALTALGTYVSTNNDNPSEKTDGSGGAQQPPASNPLAVTQVHLVVASGDGPSLFVIILQNKGAIPIVTLDVELEGGQAQATEYDGSPVSISNPLPPGQTAGTSSAGDQGSLSQGYTPGHAYLVTVSYVLTGGIAFSFSTTVLAQSS